MLDSGMVEKNSLQNIFTHSHSAPREHQMDLTERLPSLIMFELVIYSTQWQHVSLVQGRAWCYLDIQPLFGMVMTKSCDAPGVYY